MTLVPKSRDLPALRKALLDYTFIGGEAVESLASHVSKRADSDWLDGVNLTIYLRDQPAAYIQTWSISPDRRTVQVCHFALAKALTKHGYGRAVAEGFAAALREAYPLLSTIDFWERSYTSATYGVFFQKLGATSAPDSQVGITHPHWYWTIPKNLAPPDRATPRWWARLKRKWASKAT